MRQSILWPALLLQRPAVEDDNGYQVLEQMTKLSDGTIVSDLKVLC